MAYQFILFDRSEGVGTVTLNQPDQLNAFTPAMLQELADVFRGMERDPQVRAIILTGAGKAFCGGEDFRKRAEAELNSPGNGRPEGGAAATPGGSYEPTSTSFSSNFTPGYIENQRGGSAPYTPDALPVQPAPNPLLAQEFSPLNPGPAPYENPRTQAVPVVETGAVRAMPESFSSATPPASAGTGPAGLSFSEQVRRSYNPFIRQLRNLEKPVIAAVNGIAAGTGLGLALACDIRYASERARFVEVSVRVGLLPGSGTAYFLPRLIGLSKAMELAFNGDELKAAEAEQLGLVSRVLPPDQLLEETRKLAVRLAKGPSRAIGLTKALIYKSANLNLEQALELEGHLQEEANRTQDFKEGLRAFLDKRPPNYKGQ